MVLIRPHKATHATIVTPEGKKALVAIEDLDTLAGTTGTITWLRLTKKSREILGQCMFDGTIDDIKSDYDKRKRK